MGMNHCSHLHCGLIHSEGFDHDGVIGKFQHFREQVAGLGLHDLQVFIHVADEAISDHNDIVGTSGKLLIKGLGSVFHHGNAGIAIRHIGLGNDEGFAFRDGRSSRPGLIDVDIQITGVIGGLPFFHMLIQYFVGILAIGSTVGVSHYFHTIFAQAFRGLCGAGAFSLIPIHHIPAGVHLQRAFIRKVDVVVQLILGCAAFQIIHGDHAVLGVVFQDGGAD